MVNEDDFTMFDWIIKIVFLSPHDSWILSTYNVRCGDDFLDLCCHVFFVVVVKLESVSAVDGVLLKVKSNAYGRNM